MRVAPRPSTAHVIDLVGRRTLLNDRPVDGASALLDGDVLTVGQARFTVRVEPPRGEPGARTIARIAENIEGVPGPARRPGRRPPGGPARRWCSPGPRESRESPQGQILETLRLFQSDAATLFEAQLDRIEALGREIATLRDEIRSHQDRRHRAPEPFRLNLPPRLSTDSVESAAWLLQRLNGLESESRSTWKDLIARIASSVGLRAPLRDPFPTSNREIAQDGPWRAFAIPTSDRTTRPREPPWGRQGPSCPHPRQTSPLTQTSEVEIPPPASRSGRPRCLDTPR